MAGMSRRAQALLGGVIAMLLFTGVTMVYLRQPAAPVSADVALERFRSATPEPSGTEPSAPADGAPAAAPAPAASPPAADAQVTAEPTNAPPPAAPGATAAPSATVTPQAQPTGPQAPPPPPQGVYAYRTTGYEEIDAFGGSRHDYPETTYMTVRAKGCGITMRWQPLEERWDESDHCTQGPNVSIDRFSMYHEFFRQGMEQPYACAPGSHVYRADHAPGATWTVRCSSPEFGDIEMLTTVVGIENVQVGSQSRPAVRMRYDATITGYSEGTQVQERWMDQENGLMLRIVTQVDVSTQTPLGRTPYRERYQIDLLSLDPQT